MTSATMAKPRTKRVRMFRDDHFTNLVPARKDGFNVRHEIGMCADMMVAEIGIRLRNKCFPSPTFRGHIEPPSPERHTTLRTMAAEFMPSDIVQEVGSEHALITFNIFSFYLHMQPKGQKGVLPTDGRIIHGLVSVSNGAQDEMSMLAAYWRNKPGNTGWVIELYSIRDYFGLRPGNKLILPATAKSVHACFGQVFDSVEGEATAS